MPTTRRTLAVHLRSLAAGVLASAVVTGLLLAGMELGLLADSATTERVTVVLASFTAVMVIAWYLRRRGIDS